MRKTIFALALFTVILSFYVSKAELFLEDVELVEFEDEELITKKPSSTKGSDKKDKTKTPTKDTEPPKGSDKKDKTPKTDKTPPKKTDKTDKTPPKKTDKKSSTMKWVIIAVVVVLVGVAIWYFACRGGDDAETKKEKAFKEGEQESH